MGPLLNPSSLLDAIAPESLVWWLSRMTLLATLACAFLVFAYRLRPAVRHAVAVGSLLAIAALPLASALLPAWSIPVLPAPAVNVMRGEIVRGERPRAFAFDAAPMPAALVAPVALSGEPAIPVARTSTSRIARARDFVADMTARTRALFTSTIGWRNAALLVWLNVMAALLFRIGLGAWAARRFAGSAPTTRDENILRECERARRVLGIAQPVNVIVSPHVTVPLVACALRPCVMLPAVATTWPRARLYTVLLHELAHVRRRDNLWVTVARVVTAVFWFHPLVWVLSAQLRRDAECACDDIVLASGVRNSDYAEHLVAIARATPARDVFAGAALSLTTRSSLERRVVSILTTRTPRAAMSRRALASLACVSLILLVAVAAARPTVVASAQLHPFDKLELMKASGGDDALYALTPSDLETYVLADAVVASQGAVELAQRTYQAQSRESGREYYAEASELYNDDRFARAAASYMKAAEFGFRRPTALYNAGCSYALAEAPDDAIEALRAAVDEGFDRPDLFAGDEDLNALRGDPRFQKLLAEVMNSDSAQIARRSATREFERLDKRDNVEEDEWNSVGIDLLRSGDYERAADAFDREFKLSGDDGALYNQACARSLQGQHDQALGLLDQALRAGWADADHMAEDPDLIPLHGQKRFDELVALAEDLELYPGSGWNDWRFWNRRKVDQGRRWSKELPRFERVARDHPDIGRAWFNLGFAQLMSDDPEKGTASFQRALDLGYQKATTSYNLACCAAQSGDKDAAFAWLDRAEEAGFKNWGHAEDDHDLKPLRSDPRFERIEERRRAQVSYEHKHKHKYNYHYEYDDEDDDEDEDYD